MDVAAPVHSYLLAVAHWHSLPAAATAAAVATAAGRVRRAELTADTGGSVAIDAVR